MSFRESLVDPPEITDDEDSDCDSESCFGDEHDADANVLEDDEDVITDKELSISKYHAKRNYEMAGELVDEEPESIQITDHIELMDEDANVLLNRIVSELNLPYELTETQRLAINAVSSQKNVILVSPTGSGKMTIPFLSVLVLREKLTKPKGVCIITQPLSAIMNEQLSNSLCPVAVLSMSGNITCSNEEEANLSCKLEDLLDGKFPILMAHPESFSSKLGKGFKLKKLALG